MDITTCNACMRKVVPGLDNICPSCGRPVNELKGELQKDKESEMVPKNGKWMLVGSKILAIIAAIGLVYGLHEYYSNPKKMGYFIFALIPALLPLMFSLMLLRGYIVVNRKRK